MAGDSKARIIAAAEELLARYGYGGMGLKALSEAARLPYGSIYHHFPDGKDGIAAASITQTGSVLEVLLDALFEPGVNRHTIRHLFSFMADRLEASGWVDGCPVATPAMDGAATSEPVRDACEASFAAMQRPVERALRRQGLGPAKARDLASTLLATYEGAAILARTRRSRAPLEAGARSMTRLFEVELAPAEPAKK